MDYTHQWNDWFRNNMPGRCYEGIISSHMFAEATAAVVCRMCQELASN